MITIKYLLLSLERCNSRKIRPQYIDYATAGPGFSCEVRLGAELGYPGIEERVFGDKHKAFKNKRSAKIAAAKSAMLWIREQSEPSPPVGSSMSGSKRSGRSMGSMGGGNLICPLNATPAQIVNRNYPFSTNFTLFPTSYLLSICSLLLREYFG